MPNTSVVAFRVKDFLEKMAFRGIITMKQYKEAISVVNTYNKGKLTKEEMHAKVKEILDT